MLHLPRAKRSARGITLIPPGTTATERRRLLSLRRREGGKCGGCGKVRSEKYLCDSCAIKGGSRCRRPTKSQWASVQWNKPDQEIAIQLGVSPHAVYVHRKRQEIESTDRLINARAWVVNDGRPLASAPLQVQEELAYGRNG